MHVNYFSLLLYGKLAQDFWKELFLMRISDFVDFKMGVMVIWNRQCVLDKMTTVSLKKNKKHKKTFAEVYRTMNNKYITMNISPIDYVIDYAI